MLVDTIIRETLEALSIIETTVSAPVEKRVRNPEFRLRLNRHRRYLHIPCKRREFMRLVTSGQSSV